jgi:hypothetical protein
MSRNPFKNGFTLKAFSRRAKMQRAAAARFHF